MTNLTISQFISSQFPAFYDDDGPVFKSFLAAYYEWLEISDRYVLSFNSVPDKLKPEKTIFSAINSSQVALILEANSSSLTVFGSIDLQLNSSVYGILETDTSLAGTITTAENSRIVIGDGTSFLKDFSPGEAIGISGKIYIIDAIKSASELIISENFSSTKADIPYIRYKISEKMEIIDIQKVPNLIAMGRRFDLDADIDTTLPQFVKFFKSKYLHSLPNSTLVDTRFLVKHILDLYRSKGSERSFELLFRILFNADLELFYPSRYLFSASEAEWFIPKYIEVTDTRDLNKFINKRIYSSSMGASGTVEDVFRKNINGKVIGVIFLSNILGTFHYGEQIFSKEIPEITVDNAPFITGSLTSATITNGGSDFNIGDTLDISGKGYGGKAVVTSTEDSQGKVSFNLIDGGFGYTMNASVLVDSSNTGGSGATFRIGDLTNIEIMSISSDIISDYISTQLDNISNTFLISLTGVSGTFQLNENVKTSANIVPLDVTVLSSSLENGEFVSNGAVTAFVTCSDESLLITSGNTGALTPGMILLGNTSGATVEINTVFSTKTVECNGIISSIAGSNLTLKNCYFYSNAYSGVLSTSVSAAGNGYSNSEIVSFSGGGGSGAKGLVFTNSTGAVSHVEMLVFGNNYTSTPTASISTANGSGATLTASIGNLGGYPVLSSLITGQTSGAVGTVALVSRLTDWGFPVVNIPDIENLDSSISSVLTYRTYEIGTIKYITGINPGDGYRIAPSVTVVDSTIANLEIPDGNGNLKGADAIVTASAGFANGVVTSIKILDSGFGYIPNEELVLTKNSSVFGVAADSIIDAHGQGTGYWKNRKSFASNINYIQDSYYWQKFSYDILSPVQFAQYKKYVKDVVHPAGMKMFGTFKKTDYKETISSFKESSFTQI